MPNKVVDASIVVVLRSLHFAVNSFLSNSSDLNASRFIAASDGKGRPWMQFD